MTLAKSLQSAAGNAAGEANYIEDVFSTYLWNGTNGQAGPFVTGVDLLNEGGLLWTKSRTNAYDHYLLDTVRGNGSILTTNNTAAAVISPGAVNFYSDGFKDNFSYMIGTSQVSWTFRKQPKFFDVVTYTGNSTFGRAISHNLGSVPGCIIVKRLNAAQDWCVYHRSNLNTQKMVLNSTAAVENSSNAWGQATPTDSVFYVGATFDTNSDGSTYVAYLFAHDAGGFGPTESDNVISCGSYTGTGAAGNTITLGYEPQWVLIKASGTDVGWYLADNMRGMPVGSADNLLQPNSSGAEFGFEVISPTATGFQLTTGNTAVNENTIPYIYIAIRRGPMRVPESGTSVFSTSTSSSTTTNIDSGFVTDMVMTLDRSAGSSAPPYDRGVIDRLRGNFINLSTASTAAEVTNNTTVSFQQNNGIKLNGGGVYANGYVYQQFSRAPGFFDEVCYTGTPTTISHNLGVAPEMIFIKQRNVTFDWMGAVNLNGNLANLSINSSSSFYQDPVTSWSSQVSSTDFTRAKIARRYNGGSSSGSGDTCVAYLFASCPGVSKVGSYTGNGSSQTINCGFTAGARFVLIKATSTNGDWLVWDTARGINAGDDPRLALNSTAAEVADTDSVDATSSGFIVNNDGNFTNASGVTYIYLAIA